METIQARSEQAGYRDGYYNQSSNEFQLTSLVEREYYRRGYEAGKAGKDGRPENRFSQQAAS